jgi:HEAT repeat protein
VSNGASPSLEQGTLLTVPDTVLSNREKSTFRIVPIGEQRHAVVVTFPTDSAARSWQALIVAKPGKLEPEILFAGFTGYVEGEDGLRHGPILDVSESIDDLGTRRIVLGETREDLTLCGRTATLSPKMLSPKELALKPAKVQRLAAEEREQAPVIVAEPHAETANQDVAATTPPPNPTPTGSNGLLRALGASSAIGWPASLTDGDPETTWAENRGGAGRGEFVTFRAPSDVPLEGFDFVIKPGKRTIAKGTGPSQLWLVTAKQVFSVRFPSDPWAAPLVHWRVKLPTPVQTDCVAVVTESAYSEKPDAEVTFAEISATSEFTNVSIDELVGALAGGGARADSASTILSARGTEAFRAVAKAFSSFDEGGKRAALDVLDHAPCTESGETYVRALLGKVEAHRLHAIDRLRRCGAETATIIEQVLGNTLKLDQRPALELMAEIAPDRAIAYLTPRLAGNHKVRRMVRDLIAQASRSPKADPVVKEQLNRTDLSKTAYVDLLRALGASLAPFATEVAPRVEQMLATEPDWKIRYLLLAPAHRLVKNAPNLASRISTILHQDPSPFVRVEAIRSIEQLERFSADLLALTTDSSMRVRQAATELLANDKHPNANAVIRTRLTKDSWPEVRAQAAESLASQPANPDADNALIDALDDDSWLVRVKVAETLGVRQSITAGEALTEHFEDNKERIEVRVAAANSLGDLCYEPSVNALTKQAQKLKSPGMDLRDRALSATALGALGRIRPKDLAKRLEPLVSGKDVPKEIRKAAESALRSESSCGNTHSAVTAKAPTQ